MIIDSAIIDSIEIISNLGSKYKILENLRESGFNINVRKHNDDWIIDLYRNSAKLKDIVGRTELFTGTSIFTMSDEHFKLIISNAIHILLDFDVSIDKK